MNLTQGIDFNSLMEPVALRLLGEPAQKHGHEWRYGNRGSLSIDIAKGHWFDHEANAGGGVFDLIRRQGHEQPATWLRREGLLATPPVVSRPQPRIVKTYPYRDENSTLLFQVVRYEPKGFRQRRPNGRGDWIWNLQDTRRVPYMLPELVKAVDAGETIYVPEGEKDVDNLRAIGFAATTNPGGCKKWRSEYSEHLRDADVVVLPDSHPEGREHGDQVVASLHGIAGRIRVLDIGKHWAECPDKGDISAWLAAGGSAEKLKAIVDALPEALTSADNKVSKSWRDGLITAAELKIKPFDPVRIILPDLIPEGVTIVAGKPKVGKSWLALDVCLASADEARFVLGQMRPVHGDVLYLALEDNQRRLKKRVDKIVQGGKWPERLELHTEWRRVDQGGLEDIEAWIKSVKQPRLIWIDTLAKLRPLGARNEQAYAADYRAIEGLQKLAGQYGIGIVVNTHLRKIAADDPFDEVSGTLGLTGAADSIIVMKRHSGMMKVYVQGRDIESAEFAAEFNKETCRWRLVGEADEVFRSKERQAIATALKDAARSMSVPEIMAATDRRDRNATEGLLFKMEKDGHAKHSRLRGRWLHPDVPDPAMSDAVKIGKKVRNGDHPTDKPKKTRPRKSYRYHNAAETVRLALRFQILISHCLQRTIAANLTIITIITVLNRASRMTA
jgi:hypothetical protein